jgi:adenylate cyclase
MRALALLEQAIARDSGYAPALALAAYCHQIMDLHGWTDDSAANRRGALRLARQALQFGADDPVVSSLAALMLGYFGEDIDAALRLVDRALALNPSYALGWAISGWLNLGAGHPQSAIERFETSLRLDPRSNRGAALRGIGMAHFFNKRFDEALQKLLLSSEELPSQVTTYRFLAACYVHMDRLLEAREVVDRLRAMTPAPIPSALPYRRPEHRELFLSGLRLALGEDAS